jgi:hypothetical protein
MSGKRGPSACFFIGQAESCVKVLLEEQSPVGANSDRADLP